MPSMFFYGEQDAADAQGVRRYAFWLGPDGGGCVELHRLERALSVWGSHDRDVDFDIVEPGDTGSPASLDYVLPSSSRPISTKNAVTASRSSTTMPRSPSAASSWWFSLDRAAFRGRVQPSNEQAHDVFDSGTGLRGPPETKVLRSREPQFEIGFGVAGPKDVVFGNRAPRRPLAAKSPVLDLG